MKHAIQIIMVAGLFAALGSAVATGSENSGKAVYDAKCAGCHGKDAKGNPGMAKMFKVDPSALNLTSDEISKKIR